MEQGNKGVKKINLKEYLENKDSKNSTTFQFPFFDKIAKYDNFLLAGCGGGFDIYSALPFYFALRKSGKKVHLANLTFSQLNSFFERSSDNSSIFTDMTLKVSSTIEKTLNHAHEFPHSYFPEYYLSHWFAAQGLDVPVYTFSRSTGVTQLTAAYQKLVDTLNIDCILLVDGGTDSLMTGDETSLGSPEEDATSIAAVHLLKGNIYKILTCVGFGIDSFHGIRHGQFLRNVARLIEQDAYLGAFSLMKEMEEVQLYSDVAEYVFKKMPGGESIVVSHSLAAVEGKFGDYHPTKGRTKGTELFINPLMALVWCFELGAVAKNLLYFDLIKNTTSRSQIANEIYKFRNDIKLITDYRKIPH